MHQLRRNILVIDRDKLVCRIIKLFLENTGKYRVIYSTDVTKGIMSAMSRRVALILLDDRVETADGCNLMSHMKNIMERPVPLLSTGAALDRTRLRMRHLELDTVFNVSVLQEIDTLVR